MCIYICMFSLQCRFFLLYNTRWFPKPAGYLRLFPRVQGAFAISLSLLIRQYRHEAPIFTQAFHDFGMWNLPNTLPMSICFGGCISWIVSGGFPIVSMSKRWWSRHGLGHGAMAGARKEGGGCRGHVLSARSESGWADHGAASICMGSNGTCSLWWTYKKLLKMAIYSGFSH